MQIVIKVPFEVMTRDQLARMIDQARNQLDQMCGGLDLSLHEKELANGIWVDAVREYRRRTKLSLGACLQAVKAYLWTVRK